MTELHIDSKSPKFDRRKALTGAAMIAAFPFIPAQAADYDDTNDLWAAWYANLLECGKAQRIALKASDARPEKQWYSYPNQNDRWYTMGQIDYYADNVIKNEALREQFRTKAKAGLAPILEEIERSDKRTGQKEKYKRWGKLAAENDKLLKAILKSKSTTPVAQMRKLFVATVYYAIDDETEMLITVNRVKNALKATV